MKFNIIYLATLIVGIGIWQISRHYGEKSLQFYGFSENKEIEIKLDQSGTVMELYVVPGQKVTKGSKLIALAQEKLPQAMTQVQHEIDELELRDQLWRSETRAVIQRLKAEKEAEIGEVNVRIAELEAERARNHSLISELKSVKASPPRSDETPSLYGLKLQGLQEELALLSKPYDLRIRQLEQELAAPDHPLRAKIRKLKAEFANYQTREERLTITAPSDGVVGNIDCKASENVNAYATLMSFYEETPTQVKGYVIETLILEVEIGDVLTVMSTTQTGYTCEGTVTGLGSRIVEIPERLRKMPDLKTYGREVLIEIPASNRFLQKEKVVIIE